jgi:hypothetical protein
MLRSDYQFVLIFFREGGEAAGQVPLSVDWEPAREWAEFAALRAGRLAVGASRVAWRLEPVWHAEVGEPYTNGFRVCVACEGARDGRSEGVGEREGGGEGGDVREGGFAVEFGAGYFKEFAAHAASQLVESGRLGKGDNFFYLAAAFPRTRAEGATKPRLTVEQSGGGLALVETELAPFAAGSRAEGRACVTDFPVFVPRVVLEEAAALSGAAGAKETGGVLVGRLHRDPAGGEIFAEVTAQIHARGAEADLTRLSFTPQTWTEVRAAISLRRRGEIMLGWWHSHPVREWCKACAPERQQVCSMRSEFFSAHDRALHRAVFPRAYSVALVVNDGVGGRQTFSMFGWREGLLRPRGFHVVGRGETVEAETVEAVTVETATVKAATVEAGAEVGAGELAAAESCRA